MKKLTYFLLGMALLAVLLLTPSSPTHAQFVCPAEVGCAELILAPGTLIGDVFLNDQPLAFAQNRPIVQVPAGQAVQLVIRNLQSPGEVGFGELFVYEETTVNVNVRAGQTRAYNVNPRKQYIRGTLSHTCEPRSIIAGEDVSCQVLIDGIDRGVYPANQAIPLIVDPGTHVVRVQLLGGSAGLWEPNVKEQSTTITAGRTTNLRTRFDKRAHLIVNLNTPGVVGDFYINDVVIAGQVPAIDLYVAANVAQNIVVRNLQPPPSGFRWTEASRSITLGASQERTVTLTLRQESLVSRQQSAALDAMQRTLDSGRISWDGIAGIWRGLRDGIEQTCGNIPRLPSLPSVNQSVLTENPTYQEAYNVLVVAINETRAAIETWKTECTADRYFVDPYLLDIGIAQVQNAENAFNDAQNRITALRNPPQ